MKNFKKYSDVFELFEEIGFHYSEEEKVFCRSHVSNRRTVDGL
ncbi:hypothetical protein [Thermotoga sp. Cell2]|nr:hypothetical protein [Thermotoga sp. Cell2]